MRCRELEEYLVRRGHSRKKVKQGIQKAFSRCSDSSLVGRSANVSRLDNDIVTTVASSHDDRNPNERIPLVIDFHPSLPDITGILRQYHHLLQQSETMKHVASQVPLVTFRRPRNLKNFLVRGKLGSYSHPQPVIGPCNKSRCQVCMFVDSGTTVTSCSTNKSHRIKCPKGDCDTCCVVYVLTCKLCNLQYVGSTVSKFRLRFNNHRSRIRNFTHSTVDDCFRLYEYFSNHSSSLVECLTVSFVECSVDEISLRQAETEWIWKLNTVFPNGLNVNDGFHSQLRHKRT